MLFKNYNKVLQNEETNKQQNINLIGSWIIVFNVVVKWKEPWHQGNRITDNSWCFFLLDQWIWNSKPLLIFFH